MHKSFDDHDDNKRVTDVLIRGGNALGAPIASREGGRDQ